MDELRPGMQMLETDCFAEGLYSMAAASDSGERAVLFLLNRQEEPRTVLISGLPSGNYTAMTSDVSNPETHETGRILAPGDEAQVELTPRSFTSMILTTP